ALGSDPHHIWQQYKNPRHFLSESTYGPYKALTAKLDPKDQDRITALANEDSKYKPLDKSVLYALFTARAALAQSGWQKGTHFGINIGSSRGATALFEKYYDDFLKQQISSTLASPTTTLGNISSWIAHDLQCQAPEISHSITCSTALHAVINGIAWLK